MLGRVILHAFLSSADFLSKSVVVFFKKNLSGIPSESQTVWIQIRPDKMSGLTWSNLFARVISRLHL